MPVAGPSPAATQARATSVSTWVLPDPAGVLPTATADGGVERGPGPQRGQLAVGAGPGDQGGQDLVFVVCLLNFPERQA
jgi:hypothetical protein